MMDYLSISDTDIGDLEAFFNGEWSFDESRRKALINYDDVQACPGSGKTTLVSAKLILLAQKWHETHKGVCVLTHMNVAKEEISRRLEAHPAGHLMLSYPHFIGTIQEFVNKFIGIPYCRSNGLSLSTIDDVKCVEVLERTLWNGTKKFLESRHSASLYDFKLKFVKGKLFYDVPGFSKPSDSKSYKDLVQKKAFLIKNGLYFFSEMYAFAEMLLHQNPDLITILRQRFPYVFIDEMQDTQKFQDDLLNHIFLCDEVVFQRFGDPDQAIFDGMNNERPNESYNTNKKLIPIESSHRFGNDIASKIKGLSFNKLENLESVRNPSEGKAPHTIFLYDDQSIESVLAEFGNLAFETLNIGAMTDAQRRTVKVKAVGSVGAEKPTGLTIKHYWSGYDKSKMSKSFRATKLIYIVRKCSEQGRGNVSDNYNLLIQGVLDFLRKANKKYRNQNDDEIYFSKTTLLKDLQDKGRLENFQRLLTTWLVSGFPDENTWIAQINNLKSLLSVSGSISLAARDFLVYDSYPCIGFEMEEEQSSTNIYKYLDQLDIEVATIHAVKGETHDATLILETKFGRYFYDLRSLIDFFIDERKERPVEDLKHPRSNPSLEAAFLKRLYVAASRPRHLLCLAMHQDHISQDQQDALIKKGWQIRVLPTVDDAVDIPFPEI